MRLGKSLGGAADNHFQFVHGMGLCIKVETTGKKTKGQGLFKL
jgi:hypothetical protein